MKPVGFKPILCAQAFCLAVTLTMGSLGVSGVREPAVSRIARRLRTVPGPSAVRTLVAAVAADSMGQGLLISTTTFYMLRVVELSAAGIGIGLTVGAIIGVLVSAPIGWASDRWNPLTLTVAMTAFQAVAVLGYLIVQNVVSYIAVTSIYAITFASAIVTGAAMLPGIVPASDRVRTRAKTRVTSNIGISVGAGVGGVALGLESGVVYRTLFVLTAVGLFISSYFFSRLHRYQGEATAGQDRSGDLDQYGEETRGTASTTGVTTARSAFRDPPYLAITLVSAIIAINDGLLIVALPLWISQSTTAPTWIYSVAMVVNTVAVVLLQIPLSRSTETAPGAGRALRWSGGALAIACLLWAIAGEVKGAWVAACLLLVGCAAHVVGELTSSAGGWGLSYELAPEDSHGTYQGVFGTGQQISNAIVPVVAGLFLVNYGFLGWSIVGAVLLGAGLLAPPLVKWALATPPRCPPDVGLVSGGAGSPTSSN
jgi:MFS family permease